MFLNFKHRNTLGTKGFCSKGTDHNLFYVLFGFIGRRHFVYFRFLLIGRREVIDKMVDLDKSHANNFVIEGDTLIAPFRAIPGLGGNVANQIVQARENQPFLSKEDLATRGKVSKTIIDYMNENGVLKNLPDENQLSLFDF